jgi:hypothetical protein
MATDSSGESSAISEPLTVSITENRAPYQPDTPSGPSTGKIRKTYTYTTKAEDPDGDMLKYTFYWDDGTTSTTPFFSSGTSASASHKWNTARIYSVTAKATDSKGKVSISSDPLPVSISALGTSADEVRIEASRKVQEARERALRDT